MPNQAIRCPKCSSENVILSKRGVNVCEDCGHEFAHEKPFASLRIFLSYGHDSNEELVRRIKADLEKRGHDVWFDKSEIKTGHDWRRSITDGIVDSNRVLSFLSKYSTRDPGVCLDEIAIAIGVKGGNIQTILVESEQEVKPPSSISHIQWLDMHDWKEQRDAGEAAWVQWYQEKLAEIIRVVESDESRRFAGEIETLNGHLKPIKSEARICQLLSKGFYGRQWLFEAVEKWRQDTKLDSRLFWIMGAPGVGKSAFAAQLTHRRGDTVIAAQFCEWDKPDHLNAPQVVRSLAFQLATRLPDYRKPLLTLPEIAELDRKDAAELFDYLLANPLRSVINGGRERYLIVIDALDEAGEAGRNPLVEMLARNAQRLPDWLGLVVTSRPEGAVTAPLQRLNPFILDTDTESNRADIRAYLRHELAPLLQGRADTDRLVQKILDKSEGVFLYVEWFCRDVREKALSLDDQEQFPQGLGGIFFQYFHRQFPRTKNDGDILGFTLADYKERCRPLLEVMIAAQEPLRIKFLCRALAWTEYERNEVMDAFGSILNVTSGRIGMFHNSLANWLCDSRKAGPYFIDVDAGHRRLGDACWQEFTSTTERVSWYARLHFRTHLDRTGDSEKARAIKDKLRLAVNTVSVYVCSTFRDMHADRDYLVKFVFPQLQEICASRGVNWEGVDLRWGVEVETVTLDDEHSRELLVLKVALAEIDHCRPFFIGLLGERYGWVPPEERMKAAAQEAGFTEDVAGKSCTEVEILYGVLRDKQMFGYGLMYFRDPRFLDRLPLELRANFESQSLEERTNMDQLKSRIRDAAEENICLLRENYQTPEELGKWVRDDFAHFLNTFLPETTTDDQLDREAAEHEAYAQSHAQIYIGRQNYFDLPDSHVANQGPPLVLVGNAGTGKSALLSNWFLRYREQHPNDVVFAHFAGGVPDSADVMRILRRIKLEFKRRLLLPNDGPAVMEEALKVFTHLAGVFSKTEGRLVLILDGLNYLEDRAGALDLDWLPVTFSSKYRVIFSTRPGRSLDATRRRQWPEMTMQPLTEHEAEEIAKNVCRRYHRMLNGSVFLALAGKRLPDGQAACSNPLWLLMTADQLNRLDGDDFARVEREFVGSPDERLRALMMDIAHCLPPDLQGLYVWMFSRMEKDYGHDLVCQSLGLIWAARRGLSETELLDLLGQDDQPLDQFRWNVFYRAAKSVFVQRSGYLTFLNDYVSEAVCCQFVPTSEAKTAAHPRLEEYFKGRQPSPRNLDELKWQREQLGQ